MYAFLWKWNKDYFNNTFWKLYIAIMNFISTESLSSENFQESLATKYTHFR